ncbi:hypothetical protein Psfp_03655 [Pelotomaculum sp. FP]|uniref:hypothetical protein n=1 Tax=Pelotomaculum sp. FP TaxID=261474 RepID=UPI00106628CA|nr:hypothetical protein [Pelotomaculum sp. FP]TEB12860.1 hypothetical protein Psfp_03655 [Pelotomaculum sp. FP]
MRELINRSLRAAKNYSLWDYAFLKTTLLSLGILIGAYFAKFFLSHMSLLLSPLIEFEPYPLININ